MIRVRSLGVGSDFVGCGDDDGGVCDFGRMRGRIDRVGRWGIGTFGDRGDGGSDDGNGGAERDAELHGDGEQRQRSKGRDVGGVVRNGGWMRIVVGNDSASGTAITYTAPAAVPSPATVTLTATSVSDGTKSASATVTIGTAPVGVGVTITPKATGLVVNQALGLTATVTGDVGGAGVTWSATSGTFSAQAATTATYVAPNSPGSGITITATGKADPTKSATTTIAVTDLAGVTTYHNDLSRDGANNQEYLLTTANVAQATFGKLFSCTVDGAVYAQPLWVPSVNIDGGMHNVIVVATMRDSVYVFDADTKLCSKPYWHKTLIPAGETYGSSGDLGSSRYFSGHRDSGDAGDRSCVADDLLVTKTKTSSTNYIQRLHALSLTTGAEANEFAGDDCGDISGVVRRWSDEYI